MVDRRETKRQEQQGEKRTVRPQELQRTLFDRCGTLVSDITEGRRGPCDQKITCRTVREMEEMYSERITLNRTTVKNFDGWGDGVGLEK